MPVDSLNWEISFGLPKFSLPAASLVRMLHRRATFEQQEPPDRVRFSGIWCLGEGRKT
jgi:hypothetical protein